MRSQRWCASVKEPCEARLKRSVAQGIEGVHDAWAGGAPAKVTTAYQDQLLQTVRRRPRSRLRNPTRCGRESSWLTTWRSKPGSEWRKKLYGSILKRQRSC